MSCFSCSKFYLFAIDHSTQAWFLCDPPNGGPLGMTYFAGSGFSGKEILHMLGPQNAAHMSYPFGSLL